jgi:hypothetical protein
MASGDRCPKAVSGRVPNPKTSGIKKGNSEVKLLFCWDKYKTADSSLSSLFILEKKSFSFIFISAGYT